MPNWIRIASLADCPPGASLETVAGDRIVALYNVDGQIYALDGICPHQGGPLGKGKLSGTTVTCPWHGFQFNVATGKHCTIPNLAQPRFAVKCEAGEISVDIEESAG